MKAWSVFRKSLREQARDPLLLSLTLVFAPLFVLLYWLWFPSGSTTFGVLVLNQDTGAQLTDGSRIAYGEELTQALSGVTYKDGRPLLKVNLATDRVEANRRLRDRESAALVIIPPSFSENMQAVRQGQTSQTTPALYPTPVIFAGDLTNPQYAIAAALASSALDQYIQAATGQARLIPVAEEALGASAARTEFENYVPGLLVFAVMMLVFQTSITVAHEIEAGTLRRLKITHMTSFDLLAGISASQVLIGVADVLLTFLVAWALGFHSQGPWWLAVLVGAVTSLSIVGMGLIVACFAHNVTQAFLIANFPLALFMFFSNAVFPIPKVPIFTIGTRAIGLFDLLPPTHGVTALNKVLTLGAGLGDVVFELAALLTLSALYFTVGVWLFQHTHLRAE